MYDPDDVELPITARRRVVSRCTSCCCRPVVAAPTDERALRRLRAQYYGMVSEVDAQLGRVIAGDQGPGGVGLTRSSSSRRTTASSWATTA